jgi:hypothetical protein
MRKIVILVAAVLTLAVLVPATADARHTLAHRVSTLESKVTKLQRDLRTLRNRHNTLAQDVACITGGVPVAQFGGTTLGYVFDNDGAGAMAPFYTTALDVTAQGETPQAYFATMDAACLTPGRRAFSVFDWPAPLSRRVQ